MALCFLFVGCSEMYFRGLMPIAGKTIDELPDFFEGEFLTLNSSGEKVIATFHRVERRSAQHVEIFTKKAAYIDSLVLQSLELNSIDTAFYNGENIIVQQGDIQKALHLKDSLKADVERLSTVIDLGEKLYGQEDSASCKLRMLDGVYYLNVQSDRPDYHFIIVAKEKEDRMELWRSNALLMDTLKLDAILLQKFGVTKEQLFQRAPSSRDYYADLNDDEFFKLIQDQQFFEKEVWFKIKSYKSNWFRWVVGITIFIFVAFLLKRRSTMLNRAR